MVYRYLLSTGNTTTKVEEYVLDLFKIYLNVYPGDIPHKKDFGFEFNLLGVTKSNLPTELKIRIESLINKIQTSITNKKLNITIDTLDLIDEENVKLILNINGDLSESIYFNLYNKE